MEQFDIRIIRFTNKEVLGNIEKVIEGIKASITAIEATR